MCVWHNINIHEKCKREQLNAGLFRFISHPSVEGLVKLSEREGESLKAVSQVQTVSLRSLINFGSMLAL